VLRQARNDGKNISMGVVRLDTSFMTNGTSSPVFNVALNGVAANTAQGEGLISVTRTAAGTYLCTMEVGWNFREVLCPTANLDNTAADGAYATIGTFTNLAAAAANGVYPQITFVVETRTSANVLTDYGTGGTGSSRQVGIGVAFKNSQVGK
jgi:hypothetical protein